MPVQPNHTEPLIFPAHHLILFYSQTKVVVIENIACFWIIYLGWQHQESENVDKIVLLRVASAPPYRPYISMRYKIILPSGAPMVISEPIIDRDPIIRTNVREILLNMPWSRNGKLRSRLKISTENH